MSWEAWSTISVISLVFLLLVYTRIATDIVLLGGLTLLLVGGVLTPAEALSGLANEGMVTVGVLFVVVAGLQETGGTAWVVKRLLGHPRSLLAAQASLVAPVAGMSAFLNNTPVVALFMPAVSDWARKHGLPVSKLMIPLSYAAILGGTCTLIGTSTNLVVNGMMSAQTGSSGLGMFEIARVGLPSLVVGSAYLFLVGRWLLPDRGAAVSPLDDPREYSVEMLVEPGSPVDGQTIEEAGLRHLPGLFLAEIDRDGHVLPAVSPRERLAGNDRLLFVGVVSSVVDLQKIRGLKPATDQVFKLDSPRAKRCLIEAVVSDSCRLLGMTIRDGRFRSIYDAAIIAVARNGERIHKKVGDIILRPGDTLLLEAHASFADQHRNSRDFFLVSRVENSNPPRHERAMLAVIILAAMVAVVAVGWLSMLQSAMLAAGLMLIMRCCAGMAARRSVDWQVLLTIAASVGLGRALQVTGVADVMADKLIAVAGAHPRATLAAVYLLTMLLTELITNTAAAVLVFPIAMATAQTLEVDHMPFVIAIMMAASASFSTPIGYQTNLMVYNAGGYRFTDFMKVGIPLNLLMWATTVTLAPYFWPF